MKDSLFYSPRAPHQGKYGRRKHVELTTKHDARRQPPANLDPTFNPRHARNCFGHRIGNCPLSNRHIRKQNWVLSEAACIAFQSTQPSRVE